MQDHSQSQPQSQNPSASIKKKIHSRFNSLISDQTAESIIQNSRNKSSSSISIIDSKHERMKLSKEQLEPSKQSQQHQYYSEAFPSSPNRSFYHSFSNLNTNPSAWHDSSTCSPSSSLSRTLFFENVRKFQSPLPTIFMQREEASNSTQIPQRQTESFSSEITHKGQDTKNQQKNKTNHNQCYNQNMQELFNKVGYKSPKKELQPQQTKNLNDIKNTIDIKRALETKDKWSLICKEYFQAKDHLIQSKKLIPRLRDKHKNIYGSLTNYNTNNNSFEYQETKFNLTNSPIMCLSSHNTPCNEANIINPWNKPINMLESMQNKRNNSINSSIKQSNVNRSMNKNNQSQVFRLTDNVSMPVSNKNRSNSEGMTKQSYSQIVQVTSLKKTQPNYYLNQRRQHSQLIDVSNTSQESFVLNHEKYYLKEDYIKEINDQPMLRQTYKNDQRNNCNNLIASLFPNNTPNKIINEDLRDQSQYQTVESKSAEERLAACEKIKIFRYFKDDEIPLAQKRKAFKDVQTFYSLNSNQQQSLSESVCKDVLSFHNSMKNVFLKIDPLFPQQADRRGAKQLIIQGKVVSLKHS